MQSTTIDAPLLETGQRLTRDEFIERWEALPDLKFAELIGGTVLLRMPMSEEHGNAQTPISACLFIYSAATPGCQANSGSSWYMRDDMPQPENSLRILPEYGGKSSLLRRKRRHYLVGAPELVAEVSLSTKAYDMGKKKELYQKAGVREFLSAQTEKNKFVWLSLKNREYVEMLSHDGVFRSEIFPGLWIDSKAILKDDKPRVLEVLYEGLKTPEHAAFVAKLAARKKK